MKKQTGRQPTRNREEISDNFAICVCILILLAMGLVLLLGGCGTRKEQAVIADGTASQTDSETVLTETTTARPKSFKGYSIFSPKLYELDGIKESDPRIEYLKAFLSGDSHTMDGLCDHKTDTGAFDLLTGLKIGDYEVFVDEYDMYITMDIIESDLERLPEGLYENLPIIYANGGPTIDFGVQITDLSLLDDELERLCYSYINSLDLKMPSPESDPNYLVGILLSYYVDADLLNIAGGDPIPGLNTENLTDLMQKVYGFTVEIPEIWMNEDGNIISAFYPSSIYPLNFINTSKSGNHASVTAEFYAVPNKLAVCRNMTYNFELRDGIWILDSITTEEILPYEPCRFKGT